MKKWFLIVGSIVIVILLGFGMITLHGHSQRSYDACVRLGRNDVIDSNYHDALNYFQGAKKVDPNGSHAKNDLDQVQSYVSGNHYANQQRLAQAAKNYRRSVKIGAMAALNRRSLLMDKKIKVIQNKAHRFTLLYDQALELNHEGDFKRSTRHVDKIMTDPSVKLAYFKTLRSKADKLIKANHHDHHSNQISSSVVPNHNKVTQFKLTTPKIIMNHPSKATVAQARHEIKRAGVNDREMNDHDVANLIRQAKDHHSSVYRYAKDNY